MENIREGVDVNIQGGIDVIGWDWQALKRTESWLSVAQFFNHHALYFSATSSGSSITRS
jgi:hypothetical protein